MAALLGFASAAALLALAAAGYAQAGRMSPDARGGTSGSNGVTTDSGGPPISWTWSTIAPAAGAPRGYAEFQRACSVCHGSGPAKPGTRALRAKYAGKLPALLEQRTDLTPAYVKYIVRNGVTVMPPFRKTELSDADLDAIAAYLARKPAAQKPASQ